MIISDSRTPSASDNTEIIFEAKVEIGGCADCLANLVSENSDEADQAADLLHASFDKVYLASRSQVIAAFIWAYCIFVIIGSLIEPLRTKALLNLGSNTMRGGRNLASAVLHGLYPFPDDQGERNRLSKRLSDRAKAMDHCMRLGWTPSDIRHFYMQPGQGLHSWARKEATFLRDAEKQGVEAPQALEIREPVPAAVFELDQEERREREQAESARKRQTMKREVMEKYRERGERKVLGRTRRIVFRPSLEDLAPTEAVLWVHLDASGEATLRGLRLLGPREPVEEEVEELLEMVLVRHGS